MNNITKQNEFNKATSATIQNENEATIDNNITENSKYEWELEELKNFGVLDDFRKLETS